MSIKGNPTTLIKQLHEVFKDKFIFVLVQALFSTFLCLHTSDFGGCPFIILYINGGDATTEQTTGSRAVKPGLFRHCFSFFSTNCSLVILSC